MLITEHAVRRYIERFGTGLGWLGAWARIQGLVADASPRGRTRDGRHQMWRCSRRNGRVQLIVSDNDELVSVCPPHGKWRPR